MANVGLLYSPQCDDDGCGGDDGLGGFDDDGPWGFDD